MTSKLILKTLAQNLYVFRVLIKNRKAKNVKVVWEHPPWLGVTSVNFRKIDSPRCCKKAFPEVLCGNSFLMAVPAI